MQVKVMKNILRANDMLAEEIREILKQNNVRMFNVLGSPGAGKTAVLEAILPKLQSLGKRVAVIEGDCATSNDADRIAVFNVPVIQINTGSGCHLDANMIRKAAGEFDLSQLDIIFIENVGNLVCPASFDLGEEAKIAVISVTEGDDKPLKYPRIFNESQLVVLNKIDLVPYTNFQRETFYTALESSKAGAVCYEVSCTKEEGFEALINYIK